MAAGKETGVIAPISVKGVMDTGCPCALIAISPSVMASSSRRGELTEITVLQPQIDREMTTQSQDIMRDEAQFSLMWEEALTTDDIELGQTLIRDADTLREDIDQQGKQLRHLEKVFEEVECTLIF